MAPNSVATQFYLERTYEAEHSTMKQNALLKCFAMRLALRDALHFSSQAASGLKNSGNAMQNIPSLINSGAHNTLALLQSGVKHTNQAISLLSGEAQNTKNAVGAVAYEFAKCIGPACSFALKIASDRKTLVGLAAVAATIKLAAYHLENKGAQIAAQKAIKGWLRILPKQIQESDGVKFYLEHVARKLIRLMCQYKISGDKGKIAIANNLQREIVKDPEVNSFFLSVSVGITCLAARMSF